MTVSRLPNNDGGIQPTILTNKGDLLTASATSTVTNLPVGSNDQVLVADSTQTTGLSWKSYGAQGMAGKNAVINGGMDVWQRGTSFTPSAGTTTYNADRWCTYRNTANFTVSRQSSGLNGFQYCARIQRTSTSTDTNTIFFNHSLESADSYKFAGQTVTFSFYARAGANYSPTSSLLYFLAYSGTGTDQNIVSGYTGQATIINGTGVTLTTTWQKFTFTGTVGSTATEIGFQIYALPTGTAGANDYFEITGVQLELGSVATPFSRAGGDIQGELAKCQRYLPAITMQDIIGYSYGTNSALYAFPFQAQARVAPTGITTISTFQAFALNTSYAVTPSFNSASVYDGTITVSGLTITAGQGTRISGGTILFTGCEL